MNRTYTNVLLPLQIITRKERRLLLRGKNTQLAIGTESHRYKCTQHDLETVTVCYSALMRDSAPQLQPVLEAGHTLSLNSHQKQCPIAIQLVIEAVTNSYTTRPRGDDLSLATKLALHAMTYHYTTRQRTVTQNSTIFNLYADLLLAKLFR